MQVCRHWDRIVSLAQNRDISLDNLVIRVNYDVLPFRIEVFDYHELSDDIKYPPHLALVVNEIRRCSQKGFLDPPVFLRIGKTDVPCIVYVDEGDTWTKKIRTAPECADGEGITYIDQDRKIFRCGTVDAMRAVVRFARKYEKKLGNPIWSDDVLDKATSTVIGEFTKS